MSWAVLFILTLHYSCSAAQFVVTQEAAISGSIGNDGRLTCGRSGGSVTGGNYPSWYYQTPGGVPKLVVGSSSSNNQNYRPSWTSDRFTGSISGGLAVLSINRLQADDDGDYHCALYAGSGMYIFGAGTQLTVSGGEVKAPLVSIFPPSDEEIATNKATTVCTMTGFTPRTVSVKWLLDGIEKDGDTSLVSKQNDNTYMGSSYFSMPSSDWQKLQNIACKVTHQGKDIIQTLKRSECSNS
ncbi:immunoglobulin lambda-like polypeptide 1 isoform X1 [Pelobates fuscus]|uniref:immunoglobulin lambda-like polypeptide 1 isoform X1 n=1 Tax=Pelobates fuscus TaxID=191477 RepID=UPI002FE43EDC